MFLTGIYVSTTWDVDELVNRREEDVEKDLLKVENCHALIINVSGNVGAAAEGRLLQ